MDPRAPVDDASRARRRLAENRLLSRSTSSDPILVVGAGLAGLSAAYHLGSTPYVVVEREQEVGGLCRSLREGGFTFDYTGHLLHMKRAEVRALVFDLVGEAAFARIDRRSAVYSYGTYTDYPFQVNTHGLPRDVVRECVMGFAETLQRREEPSEPRSFRRWALETFGEGISRHFMLPYNEKLFRADLESISADWVSWAVPKPTWEDVIRGAQGLNRKAFGYNPSFLYPAAGGIDHLAKAFLPHVRHPELSTSVVEIDADRHEARLSSGRTVRYAAAISTMPLPCLLEAIRDVPSKLLRASRGLRHVSVFNLNLGFDAECPVPHHWVYFPEARFPFYRVGVYSNLCAATVPAGHSSFYVEISYRPGETLDVPALTTACVEGLRAVGLVPKSARLVRRRPLFVEHAYVLHDDFRRARLPEIHSYLRDRGIESVGRYGVWEYSAMEDAIAGGREAALRALAG